MKPWGWKQLISISRKQRWKGNLQNWDVYWTSLYWASWTNSTIILATELGLSTWGRCPQSGICRIVAFGNSQCNLCIINLSCKRNHTTFQPYRIAKMVERWNTQKKNRSLSTYLFKISNALGDIVSRFTWIDMMVLFVSSSLCMPIERKKKSTTTPSLLLIIWSSSPHMISVLCFTWQPKCRGNYKTKNRFWTF